MELSTGIADLDNLLQGLIPGDNVVWQVDDMADYAFFADKFARRALADNLQCIYFRFASHKPLLEAGHNPKVFNINPAPDSTSLSPRFTTSLKKANVTRS